MTKKPLTAAALQRRKPSTWLALIASMSLLASPMPVVAQAPAAPISAAPAMGAQDLSDLVGPIALYPDDLVAIILPAATNPLQLVQADRFLEKRKSDPKLAVDERWDDAVKSLLNYPDVVKKMSSDLDWTSALGEAVVIDQGAVLEAIQSFRRRAQAAGQLKSDDKQVIVIEQEIITIAPANPEVIYVPQYNPTTVVIAGGPYWGYYPTPYPSYYYPYAPGAALAAGVIWGAAIGAAWNGGRYISHYGGNAAINVNRNVNINIGNINTGNINQGGVGGGTAWRPNKQPGQVSSSIGKNLPAGGRVGDNRVGSGSNFGSAANGRPGAGASVGAGGGARPSTQPAGSIGSRSGGGGDGAFSGYSSGRQTQMDSSRGAASRSSMSGGGASRAAPRNTGARSAAGGGGARAGGGGARR